MAKSSNGQKSKVDLVFAVQELLQTTSVGTQEEIRERLQKQGFTVNQVKVSRILHKLGAVKMIENNQTVYRLPVEPISVGPNDALKQLVYTITHNESLIVIQTAPGSAELVASLLDQAKTMGILGTVAGDNTILVVPEKAKQIERTFKQVYKLLLK